jgi:hypothetical protein
MNDHLPRPTPPGTSSSFPTAHRQTAIRRRRLWPYVTFAVILAVGLAAVLLRPRLTGDRPADPAAAASVTDFTVNGNLALGPGQFVPVDGTSCAGTPAYKDLVVGAVVTVTDAQGGVLRTGRISALVLDGTGGAGTCDLKFTVPGIPIGKGTYGIAVADREVTKYDETKLRSGPLQMSVG